MTSTRWLLVAVTACATLVASAGVAGASHGSDVSDVIGVDVDVNDAIHVHEDAHHLVDDHDAHDAEWASEEGDDAQALEDAREARAEAEAAREAMEDALADADADLEDDLEDAVDVVDAFLTDVASVKEMA